VLLRPYVVSDGPATRVVFEQAVSVTASRDYTSAQIGAWLAGADDVADWNARRVAANTQVAVVGGAVVGFTDVDDAGYIDMLFVHPDHSGHGVATALLGWAVTTARAASATQLSAFVSVTARRVFEAGGFRLERERVQVVRGERLTNFLMTRPLHR
jgi:putative acetyltransferase